MAADRGNLDLPRQQQQQGISNMMSDPSLKLISFRSQLGEFIVDWDIGVK
jgi:hypothetical protein